MFNSILYIGSLNERSNSYRRFKTYEQIVRKTIGFDIDPFIYRSPTIKLDHHLNVGFGTFRLNRELKKIDFTLIDLIIVDNRPFIFNSTLNWIKNNNPAIKIALVLTDDPNGKYKTGWRLLRSTAGKYDVHFVQRSQNIEDLSYWGANRVEMCFRSYDPSLHRRKAEIEKIEKFDVGFIGSYEEKREESIKFLIDHGISVQIIGNGWDKGKYFDQLKSFYQGPSVYGEKYVDHINSMKIALHFLRVANRDEQDSRTFEIPACGTPMIAEISKTHEELFKNEEEVLYFSNNYELLERVKYLIKNPLIAKQLAENALERCSVSGYDHKSTLMKLLSKIN